jgi:hypothetical protein
MIATLDSDLKIPPSESPDNTLTSPAANATYPEECPDRVTKPSPPSCSLPLRRGRHHQAKQQTGRSLVERPTSRGRQVPRARLIRGPRSEGQHVVVLTQFTKASRQTIPGLAGFPCSSRQFGAIHSQTSCLARATRKSCLKRRRVVERTVQRFAPPWGDAASLMEV